MPDHFTPVPEIGESLRGLRVRESTSRPEGAILLRVDLGRVDGSISTSVPELWLSTSGPLNVESLVRVMVRALREAQHDSSERVAGLVLAMYAVNSASEDRCAEGLVTFLRHVVDASVEIHFVIPALEGITANFVIGSFHFERTNLHRLKDLCTRVGCDYASRYAAQLEGTQTIRSAAVPCRLFTNILVRDPGALRSRVYDDYMAAIAQSVREAMARAYTEETALMSISHEWMFPLERLVRLAPIKAISLFRERDHPNSRGWIVPSTQGVSLVQSADYWPAGADTALHWGQSALSRLRPRDDLPAWLLGPSRLVVSAMAHTAGRDWDLAGLMATTATELVLCESNQDLQKTVCRLGGCICRHSWPTTRCLDEDRIKRLYEARSKYVHEGKPIPETDAADLVLLSRAVVRAAALAAALEEQPRLFQRSAWLLKIEAIRGNEAAGFSVDPGLQKAAGMIE